MSAERRPLPPATAASAGAVAAAEMEVAAAGLGFAGFAASLEPEMVGGGSEEVSIRDLDGVDLVGCGGWVWSERLRE